MGNEAYFDKWKVGSKNLSGDKIIKVYHRKEKKFLIYETEKSDLVSFNTIPNSHYSKNLILIEKELSLIKGLLRRKSQKKIFNPRIAAAIKCAFYDEVKTSKIIIEDVLGSIAKYKVRRGRLVYLFGSICLGVLIVVLSSLLQFESTVPITLFHIMLFSVLGGFLSISTNLKNIEIDIESANNYIHFITGMTRIMISIISGFLASYVIESGLVLKSIINPENKIELVLVLIATSGFSERLIPNILEKFGNSVNN
ncbi:MAG: hypothetical protein ED557_11565 [Balneola sp.]|nr:MAG: hypothetical protein ED557_11565 [Balneola sp.]